MISGLTKSEIISASVSIAALILSVISLIAQFYKTSEFSMLIGDILLLTESGAPDRKPHFDFNLALINNGDKPTVMVGVGANYIRIKADNRKGDSEICNWPGGSVSSTRKDFTKFSSIVSLEKHIGDSTGANPRAATTQLININPQSIIVIEKEFDFLSNAQMRVPSEEGIICVSASFIDMEGNREDIHIPVISFKYEAGYKEQGKLFEYGVFQRDGAADDYSAGVPLRIF
jgi:hypothetical protein